ncbi:nuclear pore membrane glycoprotein 210 [Stomoxys calcitrans]|uniref:nuclear pore membrane glycoprotein 210 n=1 Tax=Stomoxys calcitrans TaxID=35570 RepID=UPI0027E26B5D|nr:nuclear pore membrane glycoprotein 210 [Stomoxys calcitrans]
MDKLAIFKLLIILTLFGQKYTEATKLNFPRVLLPIFDKISINFTLQVSEKGCYKWTSSRQDLILITPLYEDADNECSFEATVTVLTRERRRNTAIVLAENVATGDSLRCDVILDVIDRLGVETTTRQLYLEEAPETFVLHAEDTQGNVFTTLEGVEFSWVISSLNKDSKNWSPALRFLTFTESPYHEVPKPLEKFEAQGLKGYMLLLEGINTGTAKVTVNLPYPEYSYVQSIVVYINVLANIILEPSDVYVLPGDTINFRILQLKTGRLQEISLNNQYFLEIEDESVANMKGVAATGLKAGTTMVVLRDRNVRNDDASNSGDNGVLKNTVPSARLTVASPKKLGLSLLPHNNWITVEGEKHEIAVDLYTNDDHKITLGSRYSVSSELDELLFLVQKRSKNGSRLYGEAIREGVTPVYGSFKELTAQAELQIYSELNLTPSKVILPFDPNVIKTQKIQFQAKGGDGSYVWMSHHPRVLHINQNGLATTVIRDTNTKSGYDTYDASTGTLLTGHAHVKVALAKNQKITRHADIYFVPPVKLEIIKYNFETALKDYVQLHVAIYAYVNKTLMPLTKCENLVFDFEFTNQIFQVDYNVDAGIEMAPDACQIVHLRSTAVGLTHLKLSYKFQDKILRDEATLSVFEPLTILNPHENHVVLPVGSSRNVIYTNGPQRIYTLEAELTKGTDYNHNIARVSEIEFDTQNNLYAFNILCREVGESSLVFNVFNTLLTPNFQPYVSTIETNIYCVKPRFLNLYTTEQLRSSCPLEMRNALLQLKDHDDKFEIEIEVQDAKNRKLMNITSLFIDWEFATGEQRYHSGAIMHHRQSEEEFLEGIRLPGKDVLVTTLNEVAQNFRIKGVVTKYDSAVLRKQNIYGEEPPFGIKNPRTGETITPVIENEIRFMTVNSTFFPSDHISIFLAKGSRERIPMAQGSGFYDFQLSESGIVKVGFDNKDKELIVSPLRIGHTRLELIDRCLMNEPAHLSISVVNIGAIRVEAADRVERTKSIEAIVKLYDSQDNLLHVDPFNLNIYELSEEVFNTNILSVQLGDQFDIGVGEIRYIITGNYLGETKIVFNTGSGDMLVSSEPINVQVFPALRLYPRNTTLVVGSSVQIYYHGGPHPDVNIVYHVHDQKVISMESAIVTAFKLGDTKITGKCIMTNPINGKEVVVSEDTVEVHVVPLVNIQIKTPLVRIRSGAVMPAYIWGVSDLSPMVLGTLENMHITWSTNQPDVINIYSIFADAGIEYSDTDLISVRVKALNPGKAKIQATVKLPGGQKISTFVEVVVFKILELESPKHITTDTILLAPRSSIQLKANLDDVLYRLSSDSNSIVKVTPDGIVRTQETLGRDLVIAKTFDQTLAIGIEVKNVQYVMASLEYSTIKLKHTEDKIPRGMNFILKVSLHDNLGNEFSHNIDDVNGLKYDLSHKDIVDVQIANNLTVAINLPRETNNMIAISLRDATGIKHAEDYIKLSVGDSKHIYPTKTIFSVGDIICFDSPLPLSSVWLSSDEQIISIDSRTGVGRVLGNRYKLGEKVLVTNGDKASGNFIKYDVEVRDADVIQFEKSYDIFSGSLYRGHFVVRNHLQVDKFTNLVARNISKCSSVLDKIPVKLFTCVLKSKQSLGQKLLEHYKVTPVFQAESGRYACQIDLKTNFNEILSIVKTNDIHLELEVSLPNGLTDNVSLKFVPGIKVSPEAFVSDDAPEQDLTITGLDKVLQKVEVKPSDANYLKISTHTKAHGTIQYKIVMLKQLPLDEQIFVHVISPSTMQDIQIPVLGSTTLQKCSSKPFNTSSAFMVKLLSNIGLIVVAIVILAATVWLYLYLNPSSGTTKINPDVFSTSMKNKSQFSQSSSSGSPMSPSPQSMRSPFANRGSPESVGSLSPGNDSLVYGDTSIVSPQKRIHRRYL